MAARLEPLSPSSPPFFLPPFAMARQGVPETDSKSLEKNRSLGLSFAVGCAIAPHTETHSRVPVRDGHERRPGRGRARAPHRAPPRADPGAPRADPGASRAPSPRRPPRLRRRRRRGEEVAKEVKEALDGSSLFLVGMMGTGKSSVGKKLAASLGYSFFDTCVPRRRCPATVVRLGPALSENTSRTVERHRPSRPSVRRVPDTASPSRHPSRSDEVIEQVTKTTIPEIFAESGEDGFREIETQVLAEIAAYKSAPSPRAAASSRRRPTGCTCATASCSA